MTRTQNFYYQDPTAAIGDSVVTAIFGNPQMAQQQAQARAVNAEREAQTRLHNSQADGFDAGNAAGASLPELLARLAQPNAPLPSLDDPNFAADAAPSGPPPAPDAHFREGLPAVVAALSRMKGDKVDTGETIGTLASFLGGDEMARRGLVAQGHSPTKDFAITPERADQIAAADAGAKQRQAWGVATINHANDIPVANVRRKSAFDVAQVNNRDDIPIAEINASSRSGSGASRGERNNNPGNLEYGAFARSLGATGSDGRFAKFPTFEAGKRAQETLLAGPGYVGGGRNTIDAILSRYAPPSDGNSVDNYGDYVSRVTGIARNQPIGADQIPAVAEAMRQFETGGTGKGSKATKAAPAAKPPKPVNKASLAMIDAEFKKLYPNDGVERAALNRLRSEAIQRYQQTGDPVVAVAQTIKDRAERHRAAEARASMPTVNRLPFSSADMADGKPVPGARKAPDGKWYVKTGTKPDGSSTYSRVD